MAEVFVFIKAVVFNWAGYTTGGIVVALMSLWSTLRNRQVPRAIGLIIAALFFGMAVFSAWDEQYRLANALQAPGATVERLDPVIRPDQSWELIVNDRQNPGFGVRIELRPSNPPGDSLDLHVVFTNPKGEDRTALARWIRIGR